MSKTEIKLYIYCMYISNTTCILFTNFLSKTNLNFELSWLFAKGPKTISELTPFSYQFPNILYVAVKL